ncbi:hypothetical protein P7C71_g5334, partial [Lecanoromycetidae sp. Uapishka_2]
MAEKENVAKSGSPHFMTPTFSSSKQSIATNLKDDDSPSAPLHPKLVKADGSNAWMKTAAKRVGFTRTAVTPRSMPRSKKEVQKRMASINPISFPDKLATPSYSKLTESPPSDYERRPQISPKDKPLPSPPAAQPDSSSPRRDSKTLIDAGDKPLRRHSPDGQGAHEDWPVLHPKRSASPGTLQQMMASTGSQLTQQAASASTSKERYPVLGNITLRKVSDDDQLPISRFSASHKIPRKEVSSPNMKKPADDKSLIPGNTHIDDPFKDGVYNTNLESTVNGLPNSPSGLSAAAAAVEKSSREESKSITEPRQTRTSSLRARLSTGQLVKDGHNKVVGFTDFTAPNEPASNAVRRDSLRARKEAQARRSITPPVAHAIQAKSSRESLGGNRAPAKFVAGSRRPTHPRRPSSRGSLH